MHSISTTHKQRRAEQKPKLATLRKVKLVAVQMKPFPNQQSAKQGYLLQEDTEIAWGEAVRLQPMSSGSTTLS